MLQRGLPILLTLALASCAPALRAPSTTADAPPLHELWQEPRDLEKRDLYLGPGGRDFVPDPRGQWEFKDFDVMGASPGYDVEDERGREWNVKLGNEVQPEIVVSRLLWAIGFHQPAMHYMPAGWTASGKVPAWVRGAENPQGHARFRPDFPKRENLGDWSWYENPFVGTRPFKGLVIANVLVNNWDFKASNNRLYAGDRESDASRMYVVRDLGAALGKDATPVLFRWFQLRLYRGTKNDIEGFESGGFIRRVNGAQVEFDHHGLDDGLFEGITPEDVRWTCQLFDRLTDTQWDAAFRAAGYDADIRQRYIRKLKSKIEQGMNLKREI